MMHRLHVVRAAFAASVLLAPAVSAAGTDPVTVDFAPAVTASLRKDYGAVEQGVLRSAILTALSTQERRNALPDGITLTVTLRSVAPTHPTMQQQLDNPSLSPVRTRYLGGADLVGEIRNAKQQVLATIDYRDFADVMASGSPSLDPWADARVAIDRFAAKCAATWDRVPVSAAQG